MTRPRPAPRRPAAGATPGRDAPDGFPARRQGRLRALPSVDEVVRALDGRPAVSRARAVAAVRTVLAERRQAVLAAASATELDALALETPALLPRVRAALAAGPAWSLDCVINATGVVLHTNLGRAFWTARPARGSSSGRPRARAASARPDPAARGRGSCGARRRSR